MNFEVIGQEVENAKIKVVGVGGAGGNAVIHMINHNIEGVDFICANTDTQALSMGFISMFMCFLLYCSLEAKVVC